MSQPSSSVIAVMVTYNCGRRCGTGLRAIARQVDRVVVVDNSTLPDLQAEVADEVASIEGAHLIALGMNSGLAVAQNRGISWALEHTPSWVLLLDDDSEATPTMVRDLLAGLLQLSAPEKVGVVAPRLASLQSTQAVRYVVHEGLLGATARTIGSAPVDNLWVVVASGSLIRASLFAPLGMMEEKLFIDEIDTEFCLRVQMHGYRVALVPQAHLMHHIGEGLERRFLWRTVTIWNHSATRKYFIFRNRMWLWKRYAFKAFPFIMYEKFSTLKLMLLILLFEKPKGEKVRAMFRGIWDGLWMR